MIQQQSSDGCWLTFTEHPRGTVTNHFLKTTEEKENKCD